ncbi:PREDICTED: uncharacterized protein LOC108761209 [Trachymyrmex cornetzi]|uniref:uncharacterized protein LOC108761209 n=1 Tax=Trachymyrmex cornetzi TaxID=471704 RepID=UPI00084F6C91|nr:PREDICTED: uncharacterized protein LOC108761209 [Trachymyrmex cornetzi]
MLPSMKTNWESGMNYGFSVIRMMMWIVGVWPLQWNDIVCTFRWIVIFIVEVVTIGNETVTLWNFIIPSSCLFRGISYSTYKTLFLMQILQVSIVYIGQCANDNFFFAITMHLCGQLELLRIRFVELVEKNTDERTHYRNVLGSWVRRHYKLIILTRNIEDTFNLIILFRLTITTIVIAVSGMRIIMSIKNHDYTNVLKSMLSAQLFIVQSFLFTHAGETLRKQSESIFSAIYSTTWHNMPPSIIKDFILIMMRTKIPFQLTAGKFFYVTRRTTTDILKTALTYISFLRVTMEE